MSTLRPAKVGFVVSVAVLGVLYGVVAGQQGWPPSRLVQTAQTQAEALVTDNPFSYLVPRVYDRHGARVVQPEAVQPGLTLVSSMWDTPDGWERRVQLLNTDGEAVHEWRLGYGLFEDDSYLHGTHLLPNGDLVVNVEYVGTARLDACGNVLWRLPRRTHHSVARAEDGSFWIPAQMGARTTDYPGLDEPVLPEQILHVSADGQVLDTFDVIDLLRDNGLARYFFRRHGPHPSGELLHLNDVEPLPSTMAASYPLFDAGDLLVSLRDLHLVFVFDPGTRTIKWHSFGPFIRQHDPDFMGDGQIGVFDNNPDGTHRGTVLGGSRILVLEPPSDSTTVRFPTARSDTFYTEAGGKWQQLANGHLLLTEAQAGRVAEVDSAGRTVWEWIRMPTGARVPEILDGARYDLTPADVEAWTCSAGGPESTAEAR
ncbi:MAG: arylsulfotransferase family protein [Salinivenus sp.]